MPANWDQEVRQARVALQAEVLAELGDHPPTTTSSTSSTIISSSSNSNSGNGGSGSGDSYSHGQGQDYGKNLGQGQDQGQGQGRDTSSPGTNSPMILPLGKGLMKSFSSSEQAIARKRAGINNGVGKEIRDTNQIWKRNNPNPMLLSGKKTRKQMLESVEPLASSSSSSSLSSLSSSSTSLPNHPAALVVVNPSTDIDGGTGTGTSTKSTSSLNGGGVVVVAAGGFTLEQAQGLEGVAKVGHDQPAWKD